MKDKNKTLVCPECNGEGGGMEDTLVGPQYSMCYYCAGYGYATDDDTEERFYK